MCAKCYHAPGLESVVKRLENRGDQSVERDQAVKDGRGRGEEEREKAEYFHVVDVVGAGVVGRVSVDEHHHHVAEHGDQEHEELRHTVHTRHRTQGTGHRAPFYNVNIYHLRNH